MDLEQIIDKNKTVLMKTIEDRFVDKKFLDREFFKDFELDFEEATMKDIV